MKTRAPQKSADDIYAAVTEKILLALDRGIVPWRRPWKTAGTSNLHRNLVSGKAYRGGNQWVLMATAAIEGYASPYWLTFKQAKALGGTVRKGEKSTMVYYWKITRFETDEVDSHGRPVYKTIPLLKYFSVFNLEQTEEIRLPAHAQPSEEPVAEFDPIEAAQAVIDEMPNAPSIQHGGDRAYYSPRLDHVQLPMPEQFVTTEAYYSTAYHELAHATGHESRIGREFGKQFGSDPYAKEELIAEFTAAMLCGVVGLDTGEFTASAAYLQSWAKRFQNDKKLLVQAGGQAQKAADYIRGVSYEAETVSEEELATA